MSDKPSTPRGLSLLMLVLLLVGCERVATTQPDGWTEVQDGGGSGSVKEIVLPTGTRCVVLIGYGKGAITCDFR